MSHRIAHTLKPMPETYQGGEADLLDLLKAVSDYLVKILLNR
jgi:hypothetical protein